MFIGAIAPVMDQRKGSKVNRPGSASGSGVIVFSDSTTKAIRTIIRNSPVSLATGKAVVRRGFGAYSVSHRPGVSRSAWGLARLKAFVKKSKGLPGNKRYIQDNDLL